MAEPRTDARSEPRYERVDATLWRHTLGGILLLAPTSTEAVLVTTPGEVVWAELEVPASVDELAGRLGDLFGAETARVRADLVPLIDRLCDIGVLRPLPG